MKRFSAQLRLPMSCYLCLAGLCRACPTEHGRCECRTVMKRFFVHTHTLHVYLILHLLTSLFFPISFRYVICLEFMPKSGRGASLPVLLNADWWSPRTMPPPPSMVDARLDRGSLRCQSDEKIFCKNFGRDGILDIRCAISTEKVQRHQTLSDPTETPPPLLRDRCSNTPVALCFL